MVRLRWTGGALLNRWKEKLSEEWFMLKLTYWSLFYNSFTSWGTVVDAAMEPVFWIVDHFVRYLGPAFVVIVVCLTTTVVVIFYTCLLPAKLEQSYFWTVYHVIFGHWILINIVFHYFKAAFTSPGHPPQKIPKTASICKKCISPKPPRAHHCSVCSSCILKMDHHCPWLNNCVGHYNHRYFFLFCFYMWLGTIYVSASAYPLFKEHFYGEEEVGWYGIFYPFYLIKRGVDASQFQGLQKFEDDQNLPENLAQKGLQQESSPNNTTGLYYHHSIIYEFMLCSAVSVALGLLLAWHARLVHRAETSIEVHTNKTEADRQAKRGIKFRNPYNFGVKQNWKTFLGVTHGRTFWRHVLLPSSHAPDGDGLYWKTSPCADNPDGILLL